MPYLRRWQCPSTAAFPRKSASPTVRQGGPPTEIFLCGENRRKGNCYPCAERKSLPDLPASGIDFDASGAELPGARVIEHDSITPGPDPSQYVFVKAELQRNLLGIPLHGSGGLPPKVWAAAITRWTGHTWLVTSPSPPTTGVALLPKPVKRELHHWLAGFEIT
jgi:hypothetical protein